MDIELLNEFMILTKHLNFSKAADELYMSQSALSRHIQSLENELGITLFERSKHAVALTPIGRIFTEDIRPMLEQYKKAMKHVQMSREGALGSLDITTSQTLSTHFTYGFLIEFAKSYPDIEIHVKIENVSGRTKNKVENNETDMAILLDWANTRPASLDCDTYFKDHLYVIVSPNHPLAANESISVEELSGQPMIYFDPKEHPSEASFLERLFEKYNAVYYPCIKSSNTESLFFKAMTGQGISIVSEHILSTIPKDLKVLRISNEDAYIPVNLIWNKASENPCVPILVHAFKKYKAKKALTQTS